MDDGGAKICACVGGRASGHVQITLMQEGRGAAGTRGHIGGENDDDTIVSIGAGVAAMWWLPSLLRLHSGCLVGHAICCKWSSQRLFFLAASGG